MEKLSEIWIIQKKNILKILQNRVFCLRTAVYTCYSRKVLTETGSQTHGLSFNVRAFCHYLNRKQFCNVNSEIVLIALVSCGVFVRGGQGWYMYVGSYMTSHEERHTVHQM